MGRAGKGVSLRPGNALVQQRLLQAEDGLAVFGMDQRQRPEFPALREALIQDLVVDHQSVLVGHEVLEAVDAPVEHLGHLLFHAVRPPRDRDVEAVVRTRLAGPIRPLIMRIDQPLLRGGDAHVDDHRRAAGERGAGAGEEVFDRHRAHERHFHVGVRIDTARDDVGTAGIDNLSIHRRVEIRTDRLDDPILAEHVGTQAAICVNNGTASQQHTHDTLLIVFRVVRRDCRDDRRRSRLRAYAT